MGTKDLSEKPDKMLGMGLGVGLGLGLGLGRGVAYHEQASHLVEKKYSMRLHVTETRISPSEL